MRSRLSVLLLATVIFLVPMTLPAQMDTVTIVGTVKNATGAVIPGATVVVTNVGIGIETTVKSGTDGSYVATPLKIGD